MVRHLTSLFRALGLRDYADNVTGSDIVLTFFHIEVVSRPHPLLGHALPYAF